MNCRNLQPSALRLVLSLVICFSHRGRAATDWPEFRGPTAQGLAVAKQVPVHWGSSSNIVWKTELPGEGWSSPVIVAGKIYLTTAITTGGAVSLRALALDAKSGKLLWNQEVFQPDPGAAGTHHQKNGLASPTPIVRDGRLYVHFGHLGTAALDLTGRVLWRQDSIKYPPVHGNGGSPLLLDQKLIFSCDGASDPFVICLDAQTGRIQWKTPRNTPASRKFSFATPLAISVSGGTQIILPGSGFLAGYEPKDGHEIWRARYGEGYSVITRPVFAHGLLFVSSSYDRPVLYAVNPTGAAGDVTDTHVKWTLAKGAPNTPSTLACDTELYFVSDAGIASCVNAMTGEVYWNERLGGGFSASPVAAEGRIYFQNEEGIGTVVQAGRKFEILAKNDLGERTLASPAVIDGAIILRSQSHLWRIGR